MTWNYRIFKRDYPNDVECKHRYELHETFYDGKKPMMWTQDIEEVGPCESVDELINMLERMLTDAKKSRDDILDYHAEIQEDLSNL